jgi:hypothetical protein
VFAPPSPIEITIGRKYDSTKKASTKTPLAQCGHTSFESHYFSESLMKSRRALPTAEALTGQKTPPAANSNCYHQAFTDLKALKAFKASPSLRTVGEPVEP